MLVPKENEQIKGGIGQAEGAQIGCGKSSAEEQATKDDVFWEQLNMPVGRSPLNPK